MNTDQYANIFLKAASSAGGNVGDSRECKLCGFPAHSFANAEYNQTCNRVGLERSNILVEYFRCQRCELLFTDFFDSWTDEDFVTHIYNENYILVDPEYTGERAIRNADDLAPTLEGLQDFRILDYGSGSGLFEVELQKRGFKSVYSYDPFSAVEVPNGKFDVITCFDVIEHSPKPKHTLSHLLSFLSDGGCLLVGQTLQPPDIDFLRERWWYLSPRNGHCTTYSPETLFRYAEKEGLIFSDFGDLFALSRENPSEATQGIVVRRRPQQRRLELFAPPPEHGDYAAWHEAEQAPAGLFRWTREGRVSFGLHRTPAGSFRATFRHLGERSKIFLDHCRICVGGVEKPVSVHEDDVYAVFELPFEAHREISLISPPPASNASLGISPDERPIGLAIACSRDVPLV